MNDDGAIVQLTGVGKRYVKYDDTPTLLGRAIALRYRTTRSPFWALRGVDLTIDAGETLGVIGRNGSGKSTMLRMLAGVTAPTEGRVAVRGRVAPLISVGVGFHPELTGRENVYVNGTVLGLSTEEIDELFDAIVDFAEIREFIETPVKFYSSGMFVRLGFAVAVASQPDVLLIDEVLAVGDVRFQAKCYERMTAMKDQGATIILVTHNLQATRNMCDRTLVLHDGAPRFLGPTPDAISAYHELLASPSRGARSTSGDGDEQETPIQSVLTEVIGADGRPTAHVHHDEAIIIRSTVTFRHAVAEPTFGLTINSAAGVGVYSDSTLGLGDLRTVEAGEELVVDVRLQPRLATGTYELRGVVAWSGARQDQTASPVVPFYVSGRNTVQGIADLDAVFEVAPGPEPAG
jgi:ABC-type polysaccharide/polyol phosphate transport system ATPase subunit